MQDYALAHGARAIVAEIRRYSIHMIFWPALSPDLNLIETIWDWIKDSI
jgi:transposase